MTRKVTVLTILFILCIISAVGQKQTPEKYLSQYSSLAIQHMNKYKIPASITLAQALLESAYGTSLLAQKANNHFGIKSTTNWHGPTFEKDNRIFRKYQSVEESYEDHSLFLTTRSRYQDLFKLDITDYKGWARGLKAAGYASNPKYAELLINLIERYDLSQYDHQNPVPSLIPIKQYDLKSSTPTITATIITEEPDRDRFTSINNLKCIIASKNDTYSSIASANNIPLKSLLKYNDLTTEQDIKPGSPIYLQNKAAKSSSLSQTEVTVKGTTLYDISQLYGIQLKRLKKINSIDLVHEPLPIGRIINLR